MIPLGILGAAGAGVAGSYELIATAAGTGSSGTITLSSIPSTFTHLQIRYTAKNTAGNSQVFLRVNGSTASSYSRHNLSANGSTVYSNAATGLDAVYLNEFMRVASATSEYAAGVIDLLDYKSTVKNKTFRGLYGYTPNSIHVFSGLFASTSAVTSISFITSGGSFDAGSRFSLYGIKG